MALEYLKIPNSFLHSSIWVCTLWWVLCDEHSAGYTKMKETPLQTSGNFNPWWKDIASPPSQGWTDAMGREAQWVALRTWQEVGCLSIWKAYCTIAPALPAAFPVRPLCGTPDVHNHLVKQEDRWDSDGGSMLSRPQMMEVDWSQVWEKSCRPVRQGLLQLFPQITLSQNSSQILLLPLWLHFVPHTWSCLSLWVPLIPLF